MRLGIPDCEQGRAARVGSRTGVLTLAGAEQTPEPQAHHSRQADTISAESGHGQWGAPGALTDQME